MMTASKSLELKNALAHEYGELMKIARAYCHRPGASRTEAEDLVQEAALRLLKSPKTDFVDRRHFFASAARTMRCIQADQSRRIMAGKRGAGAPTCSLESMELASEVEDHGQRLDTQTAILGMHHRHPLRAKLVAVRVFVGLTEPEAADELDISLRSVQRHWKAARDELSLCLAA